MMISRRICLSLVVFSMLGSQARANLLPNLDEEISTSHREDQDSLDDQLFDREGLTSPLRKTELDLDEANQKSLLNMGKEFRRIGDYPKVIEVYRHLHKKYPNNAEYLFHLGTALVNTGKTEEGSRIIEKALKINPNYHDARLLLARIFRQEGKLDLAEREAMRVLDHRCCDRDAIRELLRIAREVASKGDNKHAICLYQHIHECDPSNFQVALQLSALLEKERRFDEVELLIERCRDCSIGDKYLLGRDFQKAEEEYSKVLSESPCDKNALEGLAQLAREYKKLKQFRKAISMYRERLKCNPNNKEDLFRMGILQAWTGKRNSAKKSIERALFIDPDYYDGNMLLGTLYYWSKQYCKAAEIFEKYPESVSARTNLAKVYTTLKRYDEAEELFNSVIVLDRENVEARLGLARALSSQIHHKLAKEQIEYLTESQPQEDMPWKRLFQTKSKVDPSLSLYQSLSTSKEADPPAHGYNVKTNYKSTILGLYIPIDDPLRIDVYGQNYLEKEVLLKQDSRVNYHFNYLVLKGEAVYSHTKDFSTKIKANIKRGTQVGTSVLKFNERTLFEPGVSCRYSLGNATFGAGAGISSILGKYFDRDQIELVPRKSYGARAQYQFPVKLDVTVGGGFRNYYYSDDLHNIQWTKGTFIKTRIPFLEKYFSLHYSYNVRKFLKDSSAYYTYSIYRQQKLKVTYHNSWRARTYLEASYRRSWKTTRDLDAPIGEMFFQEDKSKSRAHKLEAHLTHRFRDRFKAEIEGSYYISDFPYLQKSLKSSLVWEF